MEARNVFYYLTYAGAVDLDAVTDTKTRKVSTYTTANVIIIMHVAGFGRTDPPVWSDPSSATH